MEVTSSIQKVIIPTYEAGTPEKNPIYLEKRVYQGSSGAVYPLPVIEKIADTKQDKEWLAIYLENQYLKIMILPELGGRVQMAYDKVKQRHFIYYNQVIKPALVGLTGPWISGGIEFNWPQHHRPSTYDPVDYSVENHSDGSITVWCSEVERMFRTKGMAGFRLYPDKAYLEINVQLYNRTPHPQTFLWWANPAVKVNDHYQSVFPPDVHAVFDHGKRDVSSFPIATGTYYKMDYSSGVDISRYKNIPVPTSYMAIQSKYDFVGGYENDSRAGVLHVADHHQSPGKKQWTWGNGNFGQAWDRNLTDEDGPYIELMCGVYTDNQPDFSWLQPYEEKSFKQYFMPYQELGLVKNATKEAMLNLEPEKDGMRLKVYSTAEYPQSRIQLKSKGKVVYETKADLSPSLVFDEWVDHPMEKGDIYLAIYDEKGKTLVDYQTEKATLSPIPEPAQPAKDPRDIHSPEQLYLRGLHLEQYRHATYDPTAYYRKALEMEPGDIRNNNALGLWLMKHGQFTQAESHFRKAIETLTERNPNPYNGEPYFNLGLCLLFQEKTAEAYDHFFKATWNASWQDSGFFHCAQIDCQKKDFERALELVDRSLRRNWLNQKARHLKIILLRKLNRKEEALSLIWETLQQDRFNFGAIYEKYLLLQEEQILDGLKDLMRGYVHNFIEFSLDYTQAGAYEEALGFIQIYLNNKADAYPMAYYFRGYYHLLAGEEEVALSAFSQGAKADPTYCFPHRLEELIVLQKALTLNPNDDKAWYYLGNLWYSFRQYEAATKAWEKSSLLSDSFPTVHRNLALAYYNKRKAPEAAQQSLEKAFSLDQTDARVLMELDQLYKKRGVAYQQRLDFLAQFPALVNYRDDLYLEKISLLNLLGKEKKALDLIMQRTFHPWEGGEGKVTGQYLYSHIEIAKKAIRNGAYQQAINHLVQGFEYPDNLGEGKLYGTQENDINYWLGCAYSGLGDPEKAATSWEKATKGLSEPAAAMYYNDQQPDKIFYQGLASRKLGKEKEARSRFNTLLKHGEKQLFIPFKIDYFAVSLPDLLIFEEDLQERHELHCHYLMGLGHLGLGNIDQSTAEFEHILEQDKYHLGAFIHLQLAEECI